MATYSSDGRTTFVNEAMTRIIGGTKELVVSQNFRQLESWKVSGLLDDAEKTLSTGAEKMRQVHIITTFGKEVWLDCHLRRFKSGDEFQLLLTINDITSLKVAEQEREKLIEDLQQALAKVKTLSGSLPICASCKKIRNDKGY
jgi:PAS domain S-box-containing protein